MKGAKGVMVVGAGPTGIELAAELGAAYPRVPVKLVTNKYEIGAGMPKPVKAALQQAFVSRPNVDVIAGERGSVLDAKRHGCDVVFMCAGMEPNTSFLGGGSLKASLDEKGFVKTGLTGQVLGFPNVFALGLRQVVRRGWKRDGDDERAVPARARHREVRATSVRVERAAVHRG